MAPQGKGTESPNKSNLKKAKRAAAKSRQDLAGVFDTNSPKDVNMSDLDTVDVSPVQIPRKSNVVPELILATPSPTVQDT